jgi:hypothetical protein
MYLKYNSCLWGLVDVIEANKRRKLESLAAKNRHSLQKARLEMKKADVYLWNKVMDALNDIENETDADDVDG